LISLFLKEVIPCRKSVWADPQLLELMVPIILTAVVLEVVLIPVISGSAANDMARVMRSYHKHKGGKNSLDRMTYHHFI
jgi:hypothetical protein